MAIQFPASPTNGQVYQGYYYDSTLLAWKASPVSAGPVAIADTAPSGAIHGDMWYNSLDGSSYIYVNDGTSSQWVEVHSNTAATPGTIVNMESYTNSTKATYASTAADTVFWSGISFVKKLPTSKLVITGHLQTQGGWQYATNIRLLINGSYIDGIGGWTDTSDAGTNQTYYAKAVPVDAQVTGLASGTYSIALTKINADNSSSPAWVFNPNSANDNRWPQTRSTITIMEVAQ